MADNHLDLEAKIEDPQDAWRKVHGKLRTKVLTTPKPEETKRSTGTAKKASSQVRRHCRRSNKQEESHSRQNCASRG